MEKTQITSSPVKAAKAVRLSPVDFRCIEAALKYIDKNYPEKLSAENLSIEVGLSKEKLQAGMQIQTGKTLHKYLQYVRLEKAKELLVSTNDPLKSVADASGFVNESHFCKVFKKLHLISPVQYRYQAVV